MKGLLNAILFGNYFYGVCTIALSIEAGLLLFHSFNSFFYYVLVFTGTVIYYTHAYIAEPIEGHQNKRVIWYLENRLFVKYSQLLLTGVFVTTFVYLLIVNWQNFAQTHLIHWVSLIIFPTMAAFYYSDVSLQFGASALRNKGWLKPLVIGFVWAGVVTIYPTLFYTIENNVSLSIGTNISILFFNNFMFTSILCVMFDIKDYATDHNQQIKTFVVKFGLRRTIFSIILPLSLMGLGTNLFYGLLQQYSASRLIINIFPFILLIIVTYTLHQRKSILYYLAIIDGLMLLKAICGIIGLTFINDN